MEIVIPAIQTPRLELQAVLPDEYKILAINRADSRLWIDRGFSNPHRHLIDDAGPLPHRIPRIRKDPTLAPYLLRLAVLKANRTIIGSSGFHDLPDENGMIEVGMGIEPAFRGQGFAQELVLGMWGWVIDQPGVKTLRYTVSPDNAPSQAIIRKFGFHFQGQQIDDEDGPEDIFEMSVEEFRTEFTR